CHSRIRPGPRAAARGLWCFIPVWREERRRIRDPGETMPHFPKQCKFLLAIVGAALFQPATRGDDWPQWLGPRRDGVWRETGILEHFPPAGPPIRWRTKIAAGYAGPAVADGRVYVTDRVEAEGAKKPASPFDRGNIAGTERVLCLNDTDGTLLWKHEYDCPYTVSYPLGPRTTPVVHEGRVYTLGAEGNLFCLETENGKVVWSRELKKDFGVKAPTWGFSAHPLLDGHKLICLVGGAG